MSQKNEVKSQIKAYLKQHFIKFKEDFFDGASRITILHEGYNQSPDKVIESCLYFYSDYFESRIYYSVTGSRWYEKSEKKPEFFRLLNYINAKVCPCCSDSVGGSLYKTSYLFAPRLYVTEDEYSDITMSAFMPYDFFAVAPLETEDFLTASLPELMDTMSPAIFLLLLGKIDLSRAESMIDKYVLGEEE